MIEPGIYPAGVVPHTTETGEQLLVELGEARTGTMQCLVMFKIADGPAKGQVLPWYGSFSENAYERTMQSLRYCGWEGDNLDDIQALPTEVSVTVEQSEWDGKINTRIAWVNLLGSGARLNNPLSADRRRQFAAQMRDRARATVAKPGAGGDKRSTQPELPGGKGPGPDDDIPF